MQIQLTDAFLKDLRRLPKPIKKKILGVVAQCETVEAVTDIAHYKALHSKKNRVFFRIRVGSHRIGVQVIDDTLIFQAIGNRGDFYKTYPPN